MKEEIKALWIAELNSGKIKQTKTHLGEIDGSRCCLGVLCDIAAREGIIPEPIQVDPNDYRLTYGDEVEKTIAVLPRTVWRWAGLKKGGPSINKPVLIKNCASKEDYETHSLTTLNDEGFTFEQIADVIEDHEVS